MLHLGIYTYTVTCGVEVREELSELLSFNTEEKSVCAEVGCTNSLLCIYVKQSENMTGMAIHKLFFQMILF